MAADCLSQLRSLLGQLETHVGLDELSRICKELLKVGRRWPQEALEDEGKAFERLSLNLVKFADSQQQDLVSAFRPLCEDVRQRMADLTAALNGWLSEAPHPEKASPQRLAELLKSIEDAPQLRWYKQCPDLVVKAHFLLGVASVVRAVQGTSASLHSHAGKDAQVASLLQRLTERFFVVPEHGNILETWHDGRLESYNATLWRAAKRAAGRLKDDLQVRLVSALRRATAPVQPVHAGGKAKPQLQLELHQWPMVHCPLARAFLDFIAQRGPELGDLGQPCLGDCPPHSLQPSTLRKLLGRLDAFEVLDGETDGLGIVQLRWEAVAALAFKATGTKPKAASMAGVAGSGRTQPEAKSSKRAAAAAVAGSAPLAEEMDGAGEAEACVGAAAKPRGINWGNARELQRIIRRGLTAEEGADEWRQAWQQFCRQRRVAFDVVHQSNMPRELLADFLERNMQLLTRSSWARSLVSAGAEQVDSDHDESGDGMAEAGGSGAGGTAQVGSADVTRGRGIKSAGLQARKRGLRSEVDHDSSSASESSPSKQRRKRKKEKRRKLGLLGYGDFFGRGKNDLHLTPEVMMMNQMMGMSMMMNNPLAMMGMGASMMTHQLPLMAGMKMKKEDKLKRDKVEEKGKKDAPAPAPTPSDWSRRKEAMINADDL